jgi:hypothetical protein
MFINSDFILDASAILSKLLTTIKDITSKNPVIIKSIKATIIGSVIILVPTI